MKATQIHHEMVMLIVLIILLSGKEANGCVGLNEPCGLLNGGFFKGGLCCSGSICSDGVSSGSKCRHDPLSSCQKSGDNCGGFQGSCCGKLKCGGFFGPLFGSTCA